LEREEKEKLFQSKVDELKNVFEKQSLTNLKNLKFDIKSTKNLELQDNEDELTPVTVAPKWDRKRQVRNSVWKIKIHRRN